MIVRTKMSEEDMRRRRRPGGDILHTVITSYAGISANIVGACSDTDFFWL
jgi:hypothetical protein